MWDIIIIIVSIIKHPKIEFKENKKYVLKKWESVRICKYSHILKIKGDFTKTLFRWIYEIRYVNTTRHSICPSLGGILTFNMTEFCREI